MAFINVKGKLGEKEFAEWLALEFDIPEPKLNRFEQSAEGGADIVEFKPFVFEVKRCEKLILHSWWGQIRRAVNKTQGIPIVAFRQNRKSWEFLIPATEINVKYGYLHVNSLVFIDWAKSKMVKSNEGNI